MDRNIDSRSKLDTSSEVPLVVNRIMKEYSGIGGVTVSARREAGTIFVYRRAQPSRITEPTRKARNQNPWKYPSHEIVQPIVNTYFCSKYS